MWMTGYIKAVKCGLRDQHGFKPSGGTKKDPIFKIVPDGLYPMSIEGKTDYVKIKSGSISCCNWKNPN